LLCLRAAWSAEAGGLYGDPTIALGPSPPTAGILVPAFLGHDAFNLIVGASLLLGIVCLAQRGNPIAVLLWPAALLRWLLPRSGA
jgi:hypothetical protein